MYIYSIYIYSILFKLHFFSAYFGLKNPLNKIYRYIIWTRAQTIARNINNFNDIIVRNKEILESKRAVFGSDRYSFIKNGLEIFRK